MTHPELKERIGLFIFHRHGSMFGINKNEAFQIAEDLIKEGLVPRPIRGLEEEAVLKVADEYIKRENLTPSRIFLVGLIKEICARFRPMVLPEKKEVKPLDMQAYNDTYYNRGIAHGKALGHNACLAEVKRMNGINRGEKNGD